MSNFIKELNHISLQVQDLDIARKWFIDTLGLTECMCTFDKFCAVAGKDLIAVEHNPNADYSFDHYGFEAQSRESMGSLNAAFLE